MTTVENPYQSDFARRFYDAGAEHGLAEGRAEGRSEATAEAVIAILRLRGIVSCNDIRDRIRACTDLDQLDAWIARAITIDKVDELFD